MNPDPPGSNATDWPAVVGSVRALAKLPEGDSGTPSSKEGIGAKAARKAREKKDRQESEPAPGTHRIRRTICRVCGEVDPQPDGECIDDC